MKAYKHMLIIGALATATAMTLLCGCATQSAVQQKESMLLTAGFKAVPATTPEQQRLMKTLPSSRVSPIKLNGKVYFAYPDSSHKTLYVGNEAQYLAYEAKIQAQRSETNDWDGAFGTVSF